jgi:thymidylate synthase
MTKTYEDLLQRVWNEGTERPDRTGTGTTGIFGGRIEYNLKEGFPLITSKRVFFKGAVKELEWFLSGSTNEHDLREKGVKFWKEWARDDGELGPIYGAQWRKWLGLDDDGYFFVDQIANVLHSLEHDPFSRRHIVSAWNVGQLHEMALAPCHLLYQFHVREDHDGVRHLSIQVYQRSADMFLGVPVNIASYALLNHLVAHHLGYEVDKLIWVGGDCHIYSNHTEQVAQQLAWHSELTIPLPTLEITGDRVFDESADLTPDDFEIELHDYNPRPFLRAPVAV